MVSVLSGVRRGSSTSVAVLAASNNTTDLPAISGMAQPTVLPPTSCLCSVSSVFLASKQAPDQDQKIVKGENELTRCKASGLFRLCLLPPAATHVCGSTHAMPVPLHDCFPYLQPITKATCK